MKNLTNEETNFIKKLANEIAKQDNRGTQNVGFMVQEDYLDYVENWEYKERVEDIKINALCDACSASYLANDDIPDLCDKCDDDCFIFYNKTTRLNDKAWVFLTEKACDEHIANNDYHYNNPRSYWIHFWRNQEMVNLVNVVFKLWWVERPHNWDKSFFPKSDIKI